MVNLPCAQGPRLDSFLSYIVQSVTWGQNCRKFMNYSVCGTIITLRTIKADELFCLRLVPLCLLARTNYAV